MKYMLLIYNDPQREPAYGTPEFQQMMGGFFALNEKMTATGSCSPAKDCRGSRPPPRCAFAAPRWQPWTARSPKPRSTWAATT